jgi:hypothetical protein
VRGGAGVFGRRRGLLRWTTAVNVKLLLPPRQSRGTSLGGLAIGMAGYAEFEDMSLADAYVNAAMILSGI